MAEERALRNQNVVNGIADALPFDRPGFLAGVSRARPVGVGVSAVGLVFGVLARTAGLSALEALLMSALVFAGAAQFVALGLWISPLPVEAQILTTLIVNLRHVLMGAALVPWFSRLSARLAYPSLFFMVDESWALTISELRQGTSNGAFLLGSGLTLYIAWLSGTLAGATLGNVLPNPHSLGLDFAFTAVFLALLVGLWKGMSDLLPWGVAAVVGVAGAHVLPGKWYILLGGLAGSVVGAVRYEN